MDEFTEITDYIQEESGYSAELITGYGIDQSLGDSVNVTIIATGFQSNIPSGFEPPKKLEKEVVTLTEEVKTPVQEVVQTTIVDVVEEVKSESEPFIITKNETPVVESVKEPEVISEVKFELNTQEVSEFNAEVVETPVVNEVEENSNSMEFVINEIETEFTSSVEDKVEEPSFSSPVSEEIVFNEIKSDVIESKEEEPIRDMTAEEIARFEREEKIKAAQERIKKLKDLSLKMKSPEGLYELEKEPSFVRQNIKIEDSNYSTESNVSRYTLSEGDDKKFEIKPNNPFLHDNVD
jgi:cell division protein FtsZ